MQHRVDRHEKIVVEGCETNHHYFLLRGHRDDEQRVKASGKSAGVGFGNTRVPRQRTASARMVSAEGGNYHNILSVGEGSPVEHTQERCGSFLRSSICVIGRTTTVARSSATYCYTQYWQRKHRFVSGNES